MNEPVWLNAQHVFLFNEKLVAQFGGLESDRVDDDLLDAVLARPQQKWHDEKPRPSLPELAASYAFGLAKNHAFADGNKRTAYVTAVVFLQRNGLHCAPTPAAIVEQMVALAAGMTTEAGFARWLDASMNNPSI